MLLELAFVSGCSTGLSAGFFFFCAGSDSLLRRDRERRDSEEKLSVYYRNLSGPITSYYRGDDVEVEIEQHTTPVTPRTARKRALDLEEDLEHSRFIEEKLFVLFGNPPDPESITIHFARTQIQRLTADLVEDGHVNVPGVANNLAKIDDILAHPLTMQSIDSAVVFGEAMHVKLIRKFGHQDDVDRAGLVRHCITILRARLLHAPRGRAPQQAAQAAPRRSSKKKK